VWSSAWADRHLCRPAAGYPGRAGVCLMESRQTPELRQIAQRAARRGQSIRPWYAAYGWKVFLSALFPSLTNVVVSPRYSLGRVLQVMAAAGASGLWRTFGGLGVKPRTPWIGMHRHQWQDTWTHLSPTCWTRAVLDAADGPATSAAPPPELNDRVPDPGGCCARLVGGGV